MTVFLFIILAGPAAAFHAGEAEITGVIRVHTGAVVPQAAVLLTERATNQSRSTTTDGNGAFRFSNLKPGFYRLDVEQPGFKRYVRPEILLHTRDQIRLEVELQLGSPSEIVMVSSAAPGLETFSANLGQVVDSRKIVSLPLNGRNFIQLAALSAGVALPPGSAFPRINGGRPRVNELLFDGISVLQPEPGQVAFLPVIDAIEEFRIEINSPPAEFGRFNGGVINLTTKSGSNELHGSVFGFLRNEALNARNLFTPRSAAGAKEPHFRRQQFGFVLGGPIRKNRTHFFVDYQGTRQRIGRSLISTVPTLLQREGVFSESSAGSIPRIYDPSTTTPRPGGGFTRDLFPDGRIPEQRIDPVAKLLLARYPLPTTSGTANNYQRIGNERLDQDQFDVRIDHQFSSRGQIFARFSRLRERSDPATPLIDGSGSIAGETIGPTDTRAQSLVANYFHFFTGRVASELRMGHTRRSVDRRGLLLPSAPSAALNLPGIPANGAFGTALPTFVIDGFQQVGSPPNANSEFRTDVTQIGKILTLQRGKHTVKTGIDFRWERLDILQPALPTGLFRFSNLFTDLPGATGTGSPFASFLLGQVQTFSIDIQGKALRPRAKIQEYFAQTDWQLSRRWTIHAGLRYTLNFPSTEVDDEGAVFNLQTQKLEYLGRDGFGRSSRELHRLNFAPRMGMAYRLNDKTVLRSAYGLIWIEQAGITTPFTNPQFPFIQTVTQRSLDNIRPAFTLFHGPSVAPIAPTPDAGLGQGVFTVDRNLGSGYAQQWNLTIQREVGKQLFLELSYAGSKITHIGIPDTNINQLTVEQLKQGNALLVQVPNPYFGVLPPSSSIGGPTVPQAQILKPFPRFTTVSFYRNNVGNSNYHAGLLRLEKRFSRDLSFLFSYTWSKLIDEASAVFESTVLTGPVANSPVADSFNRRFERDVSNGDIPNVLVASFTYELPLGPNRRFKFGKIVGGVLHGWEVAGILTLQSGIPLAVTQSTNFNAFAGYGTQRPDRIGNPHLPSGRRTTGQFFETGAFRSAPQFRLGDSSRNPVRGPAYRNADLAFLKRAGAGERATIELRVEIFNLTNTPPLGPPNMVLGTPGFGSITSAGDPRVLQLALKLHF